MPNHWQRVIIGKARYAAGSAIAIRNKKLSLAKEIAPVRLSAPGVDQMIARGRVTSVLDYVQSGPESGAQIDNGREPYLLADDIYNPGGFTSVAIHDCSSIFEQRTKLCMLEVHRGAILVKADTAIYWK